MMRLQSEIQAAEDDQKQLSVEEMVVELVDYFIENDLPWQWTAAGVV